MGQGRGVGPEARVPRGPHDLFIPDRDAARADVVLPGSSFAERRQPSRIPTATSRSRPPRWRRAVHGPARSRPSSVDFSWISPAGSGWPRRRRHRPPSWMRSPGSLPPWSGLSYAKLTPRGLAPVSRPDAESPGPPFSSTIPSTRRTGARFLVPVESCRPSELPQPGLSYSEHRAPDVTTGTPAR